MLKLILAISTIFISLQAFTKINVVASTADIQALVSAVGADQIQLTGIVKGSIDPHYLEAKPSYMVKLRDADLLVVNGLSLEIGWMQSLIRGARNPKVNPGSQGYLDLGALIEPLQKPTGSLSRAMGDVHPNGNPHFTLDPIRMGELAIKIAVRLGELDSVNKDAYVNRAKTYQARLVEKTKDWQARLEKSGVKKLITYHPSLNYFLDRFHLVAATHIESKPGVPPTAGHILDVIQIAKKENIQVALVDNFFDTKIADRIAKENPKLKVKSVGISVDSAPGLKTIEDVQEQLVKAIEEK